MNGTRIVTDLMEYLLVSEPGFIGLSMIAWIKKIVVIAANRDNPGSEFFNSLISSEISVFIRVHPWLKRKKTLFYLLFVNNPG